MKCRPLLYNRTTKHTAMMNHSKKHLKCDFTQTTSGADQCDLTIHRTGKEENTAAEVSVVGDVATVVVKNEYIDIMLSADNLKSENDNYIDNSNNDCKSDLSMKSEVKPLDDASSADYHKYAVIEHSTDTQRPIKRENIIFGCTVCYEDFLQEDAYNEHMILHLQDAGDNTASQVCEPRAAVSRSCDSLVLQNRTGSQRLNDDSATDCAQALVAPLSSRLAANNNSKVQVTEDEAVTWKDKQILETNIGEFDNHVSQSNTKTLNRCQTKTNCEPQLCNIYKKPKRTVLDVNAHMKTHTAENSTLPKHTKIHTGTKFYSCDVCDYKTAYKGNFVIHESTHTGVKPYSCETCNYKTAYKNHLLVHKRTHTGEKPYSCETCNYRTANRGNLLMHKRIHSGEKPYSCKTCDYKTAQKSSLLKHKRTHTGEKPFSCTMCNYKTAEKRGLERHNRTHTGEKPFSCETCDYKSAHKSDLERHKRTHTGAKPYSCETCNYKTASKSNLLKHRRTHTDKKPFS
ncbi:zinc finger protein 84-like isoform X2 [Bicyclus anynana]|uniref:Zinc finger protein 84-like isoform X2 n=1 Tax=Bicyclus anynana TaxID=110368 RepID=A0ABM3M5S4_BICAN|nr:zinc finger protein 84-like isoform X2 [Bicyclus anynana]